MPVGSFRAAQKSRGIATSTSSKRPSIWVEATRRLREVIGEWPPPVAFSASDLTRLCLPLHGKPFGGDCFLRVSVSQPFPTEEAQYSPRVSSSRNVEAKQLDLQKVLDPDVDEHAILQPLPRMVAVGVAPEIEIKAKKKAKPKRVQRSR